MQYHLADNLAHNLALASAAFAFNLFGLKRKLMLNNFWTIFHTPGLPENSTPQQHQKKLFPRLLPGLQDRLRQLRVRNSLLLLARSELQDQHEQKDAGHVDVNKKFRFKNNFYSIHPHYFVRLGTFDCGLLISFSLLNPLT